MAKKKSATGNRYPMKYKMEAITILKDNGYNYKLTGQELGMNIATLHRWQDQLGNDIPQASTTHGMANNVTDNFANRRDWFIDQAFDIKVLILNRMKDLVKSEKNLDRLQKALKTLSEIDGTLKPDSEDGPQEPIENTYEQINNYLIQKGYESKTPITVIGDQEE